MKKNYLISGAIGVILGFVSGHGLFLVSWLALIPWAIAGFGIGFLARAKKQKFLNGAIYGFGLCLAFLITGFKGDHQMLVSFIGVSILISLFGALCGAILAYLSSLFQKS